MSDTTCNKIRTTAAFTIMALILAAGAVALALTNKARIGGGILVVSGAYASRNL
jgi:uncharacterized membrane protein